MENHPSVVTGKYDTNASIYFFQGKIINYKILMSQTYKLIFLSVQKSSVNFYIHLN